MKVVCLYAFWIMAVAAQGKGTPGQSFTLFEKLSTWNEAQDVCDSVGQKMLIIRNQEESTVFGKIAEKWKTDQLVTTDIWTGLYDRQASSASDTQYHWQGDCSPLGNFDLWRENEPNHQDQDFCVRLHEADYLFRTITCNTKCQVVCQKEEDCQFETLIQRGISETHFNVSSTDVASCQELCLTRDFGDTECVACEYTPILNLCRMALSSSLYIGNEQPATSDSTSSSVYIKRCSIGYYNRETLNIVDNSDTKPIDRCPAPTTTAASNAGGSTESTFFDTTPATVTSSHMATTTNTGIPVTTSANAVSDATPTATILPPTTAATTITTVTTSANAVSDATPTATILNPTAATTITTVTTSANAVSSATVTTATAETLPPNAASSTTTPADITPTSTTIVSTTQFVSTSTTTEPSYLNSSTTTNTTLRLINDWETCNISVCICQRQVLEVFNWKEEHQLLILKKTSLSSYRRSKISVVDERPSAISIGATGTTVIILVVLTVASKDLFRCCVWLLQLTKAH